jgi:hypothetical protein
MAENRDIEVMSQWRRTACEVSYQIDTILFHLR